MSGTWEFIKRHKGKVIVGGAALIGGAIAYSHTSTNRRENPLEQDGSIKIQARRHYVFDSNQRSCDQSIMELVPSIKQLVEGRFNVDRPTEELQNNPNLSPQEKLERWNSIKIATVCRIAGLAYSYSLLTVALKAQISILASEICAHFEQPAQSPGSWLSYLPQSVSEYFGASNNNECTTTKANVDVASRQIFLQCIQYFTTKGVSQLLNMVEKIVAEELSTISLKQDLTRDETRTILERIEKRLREGDVRHFSHLIAPNENGQNESTDPLQNLLRRLVRAIESSKCRTTTSALVDYYLSAAVGRVPASPTPLAKQIPLLSDAFHSIGSTTFDSPLQNSLCSSDVHQYSVEVFNAPRML